MSCETPIALETLFADERKIKILDLIKENQKVTVAQLSEYFRVSGATVRSDLRELESCNLVKRTHGGAMLKTQTGLELEDREKLGYRQEEKRQIGELALTLIEDGDTIVLDTGTTTLELAVLLEQRRNLTVVVNDIKIASVLEAYGSITVVVIGGVLRRHFHCTMGTWSKTMLDSLCVDTAFMGTNGFSAKRGATTPDINHADIKRAMTAIAGKTVLLCDSSKIGHDSFAQFAAPNEIDILVTDKQLKETDKIQLETSGIQVLAAK